jgi:hypothetical protein
MGPPPMRPGAPANRLLFMFLPLTAHEINRESFCARRALLYWRVGAFFTIIGSPSRVIAPQYYRFGKEIETKNNLDATGFK